MTGLSGSGVSEKLGERGPWGRRVGGCVSERWANTRTAFVRLTATTEPAPADIDPEDWEAMAMVGRWAREFLCRPNPSLGRPGEVCPFTRPSIDTGMFYLTTCRPKMEDPRAEIAAMMRLARRFWEALAPTVGVRVLFKAVAVVFPGLPAEQHAAVIDGVQRELALEFQRDGLMIGEFYPTCAVQGLHNAAFRPMQAPVALLAIRKMALGDLPFMWHVDAKIEAYLRQFGESGRQMIAVHLEHAARLPGGVAARLRGHLAPVAAATPT